MSPLLLGDSFKHFEICCRGVLQLPRGDNLGSERSKISARHDVNQRFAYGSVGNRLFADAFGTSCSMIVYRLEISSVDGRTGV